MAVAGALEAMQDGALLDKGPWGKPGVLSGKGGRLAVVALQSSIAMLSQKNARRNKERLLRRFSQR